MSNINLRRIGGGFLALTCLSGVLNILTLVSQGQSIILLVFALFLAIIGLMGIGMAFNFNNILNTKNQTINNKKKIHKATSIGSVVTILAVLWLAFSIIKLLLSNSLNLLGAIEDLALPTLFIIVGLTIKK